MLALTLLVLFFLGVVLAARAPGTGVRPSDGTVRPVRGGAATPTAAAGLYRSHSAAYWAWRFRQRTRQLQATSRHLAVARRTLHHRWQPTVDYSLRLASAVSGVSYWQLRSVSHCESTHNPFATNGRYKGLFQLGWSPFGFSPFDPIANALSAALTVAHDGGWRQWECKP